MPDKKPTREQRFAAALSDIAAERGRCAICGRLADMPSNCTPIDCDRAGCAWAAVDPVARAKEALANG